jgi:hypothetical protein
MPPNADEQARNLSLRLAAQEADRLARRVVTEEFSLRDEAIRIAFNAGASSDEIADTIGLPDIDVQRIIDGSR